MATEFTLGINFEIQLSSTISRFKQNDIYKAVTSDKEFTQYIGVIPINGSKQVVFNNVILIFINKEVILEITTQSSSIEFKASDYFIWSTNEEVTINIKATEDTQVFLVYS